MIVYAASESPDTSLLVQYKFIKSVIRLQNTQVPRVTQDLSRHLSTGRYRSFLNTAKIRQHPPSYYLILTTLQDDISVIM
jgi:hypothetical protein